MQSDIKQDKVNSSLSNVREDSTFKEIPSESPQTLHNRIVRYSNIESKTIILASLLRTIVFSK